MNVIICATLQITKKEAAPTSFKGFGSRLRPINMLTRSSAIKEDAVDEMFC